MLADAGARLVILGHSERREHHQETDQQVAAKVRAAARAGMAPVICVGETHEQRLAGQTMAVVEAALLNLAPSMLASCCFAVAYEPRWAIGSGRTASLEDIGEVHALIREILASRFGENGRRANILYGGSVTGTNARAILRTAEVGGVLVGGASLSAREFSNILRAASA